MATKSQRYLHRKVCKTGYRSKQFRLYLEGKLELKDLNRSCGNFTAGYRDLAGTLFSTRSKLSYPQSEGRINPRVNRIKKLPDVTVIDEIKTVKS